MVIEMSKALQILENKNINKEQISIEEIAEIFYNLPTPTLKRKIKLGDMPKTLVDSIKNDYVPIYSFIILAKMQQRNLQQTKQSNSTLHPNYLMIGTLLQHFGTALIPYEIAAAYLFGWSKKTANARLRSGEIKELGLVTIRTYESTHSPVFVFIQDIINFILVNKNVTISTPKQNH